jgi:hypothetical protein
MASTTVAGAGHESEASRQPPAAAEPSIGESSLLATTEITDGAGVVTSDAEISDARAADVASPGSEGAGSSGGEDAPGASGSVEHPGEPVVSEADGSGHGDDGEQVTRGAPADHGGTDDLDDPEAEQGSAPPEPAESGILDRTGAMPFSEPEADVMYRPNASFANDDDVSYPLPFGTGPGDLLGELLARSEHGENIDLDTIFSRLADLPGGAAGPPEDLPFGPEGLRGTGSPGADAAAPDPVREMSVPAPDHHGPDQDHAGHERVPVSHDLDI